MSSRSKKGGLLIDRKKRLSFTFNGKNLFGLEGDTLASALLANDQVLVARSFKYHRPRGLVSSGVDEPNALMSLGSGGNFEPNRSATTIELDNGMEAVSQNHVGSLEWDLGSINNLFAKIFPAGFYYKTFMRPKFAWKHLFEPLIRNAAGLGKAPSQEDGSRYDFFYAHVDILVVGAGMAGLLATYELAQSGLSVLLVEQRHYLGGYALSEDFKANDLAAPEWLGDIQQKLADFNNVVIKKNFTAVGIHDHKYVIGSESLESAEKARDSSIRQRLWRIRSKQVILTTGSIERPLIFPGNDVPGVMLSTASLEFYKLYGVLPGDRVVLVTNNDSAYLAAINLHKAGLSIPVIVDVRDSSTGDLPKEAISMGIRIEYGKAISRVLGNKKVKAFELCSLKGEGSPQETIYCDSILMSGGWSPTLHLWSHCGGKLIWDSATDTFLPDALNPPVDENGEVFISVAGSAHGNLWPSEIIKDVRDVVIEVRKKFKSGGKKLNKTKIQEISYGKSASIYFMPERAGEKLKDKCFVDFQNDVKISDLRLAVQEGFESVEHLKRYTTLGMATDQGKLSNINGLKYLADLAGKEINQIGTTTFRPPFTPISLGSIAGEARKDLFKPVRRTSLHWWHDANNAVWEPVGDWKRPYAYVKPHETVDQAIFREVSQTRNSLGILDASTLGKIIVSGSDAGEFLDLIYTNTMSTLNIGRCRYGLMCNENGFLFDDGVVVRLDQKTFLCHTTTGGADRVYAWMEEWHQTEWWDKHIFIQNVTEQFTQITIAGPKSRLLLESLGGVDVSRETLRPLDFSEGKLANIKARVFRISFSGELSFEVSVPNQFGMEFWTKCLEAGARFGITPYGTEALHVMRAEKGFIMIGDETDGTVIPQDLNLGWAISKKKKDFIGKRAQERIFMNASDRKTLVGLSLLNGSEKIPDGAQVILGSGTNMTENLLGHVSSTYFSPTLNRPIAMALLKNGKALLGQKVKIPISSEKNLFALVTEPKFYDVEGSRQND